LNSKCFSKKYENKTKAKLIRNYLNIFQGSLLVFSLYNFFILKQYSIAFIEASTFIATFSVNYFLYKNIKIASFLAVLLFIVFLNIYSLLADSSRYSLVWQLTVPMVVFYILDITTAKKFIIGYIFILLAIIIYLTQQQDLPYKALANIMLAFIFFSYIAYKYETNKITYEIKLKESCKKLETVSNTDKLTKLYNRSKINRVIERSIYFYKKYDKNFSIILLDIDDFKQVNDTYGHLAGDIVLKEFANVIKSNLKENYIAGRWGGEEFMIILPQTSLDDAVAFANKLKQAINNYNFSYKFSNSATFGVAEFSKNDTKESIIDKADKALYKGKEKGKNQVVFMT
jgi:diguanylate cyclase (GGDEF)-like protein